eukprot:6098192-Prymnesium_polylepis.2
MVSCGMCASDTRCVCRCAASALLERDDFGSSVSICLLAWLDASFRQFSSGPAVRYRRKELPSPSLVAVRRS